MNVLKEFKHFGDLAFRGDIAKMGFRTASINQACINDRILYDIAPVYKSAYPKNVDYYALYNDFNMTGIDPFMPNFWVPQYEVYRKSSGTTISDPMHIGPWGYALWGKLIGEKLKSIGWNRMSALHEIPEPVIEIDSEGPNRKIRRKALSANIRGKENEGMKNIHSVILQPEIGAGLYGGFYQEYKINNAVIYLKQIKGNEPVPSGDSRYGEPYLLSGTISGKYKELGGPAGSMGFPTSDVYLIHYGTIYRVDFECGAIENNTLDFLNSTYVYYHNPKPEGCK